MGQAIRFSQLCQPTLKAGSYQIEVDAITSIQCRLAPELTEFTVSTERFRLPPDQVYSVYPPRNAVGDYSECLPHMVLTRRTLPWEKTLLEEWPSMPWVALLVFDETDGVEVVESNCAQALQPEQGTFVPSLLLESYEDPEAPCAYVHIPVELAAGLLPYAEALSLLAHGKGVSLDPKVTDSSVKDDWFATVVTNRFSLEPENPDCSIRHTACLVSLEGYESCLKSVEERQKTLSDYQAVRMIVLSSWSFSTAKAPFDFYSTFSSLDAALMNTPYTGENETVNKLCKLGYWPMNHQIRDGSRNVSWYQSPLIPYEEASEEAICARFADQWLAYDPELGMMDIRYASAWQIGRSMALADQAYVQRLYTWRQQNIRAARTSLYRGLLSRHLAQTPDLASLRNDPPADGAVGHGFIQAARADQAAGRSDSGKALLLRQLHERYKSILMRSDES